MSEYEPGTVAVATVRGIKGVRAFRMPRAEWVTAEIIGGCLWHNDSDVTDIRPLVVLDIHPNAPALVTGSLVEHLRKGYFHLVADQIEAQTKPPRIPEPGKYGVVTASARVTNAARSEWVNEGMFWRSLDFGNSAEWDELIDPTLVREGVAS